MTSTGAGRFKDVAFGRIAIQPLPGRRGGWTDLGLMVDVHDVEMPRCRLHAATTAKGL